MSSNTCSRCLLSDDVPGVKIKKEGVCSVCIDHDRVWGDWDRKKEERSKEITDIFNKIWKKKKLYDVLVPLSGGKDSTYILYLCKKKYNLKCLAVTFENGFLSDHARDNIKSACEKLSVDHVYYGLNNDLLTRLYSFFFLKSGFFCPVCMRGIQVAVSRVQLAFDIPLSIRGTSKRTEEHIAREFFLPGDLSFLENVLDGDTLINEASVLLTPVGVTSSPRQIKLPDYIDWDYDEIFSKITNELGWKARTADAEHMDCKAENIVSYFRYKKFPALIPEMLRFSKLVTAGLMTREEAQKRIEEKREEIEEPENMGWFQDKLGITREEIENVLSDPLRHMKYLKDHSRAWRRIRALKKRYIP